MSWLEFLAKFQITDFPHVFAKSRILSQNFLRNLWHIYNFSAEFYEVFGYRTLQRSSNYDTENFMSDLKKRTQHYWFIDQVRGEWRNQFLLPFSVILTRHGFCFAFNMQPAQSLLNLEKLECQCCVHKFSFHIVTGCLKTFITLMTLQPKLS